MFRQAASAGYYNSLESKMGTGTKSKKSPNGKQGKRRTKHALHFHGSQKGNDVIREEPFDKDPSKIQSTTQKPPKS